MNRVERNTAAVTAAAATVQHHTLSTSPNGKPQVESHAEPTVEAVPRSPILISENEVLFSTAATVPVRATTISWWAKATRVVLAAMHRVVLTSTPDEDPAPRFYPSRLVYLEHSLMAREMHRL